MLGLANTVSSSSTPESKYSLTFDGADDYLDTGDTFSTTFAGDFSISMWLKPDDAGSGTEYIFGAGNASLNDSVRAFIVNRKVGIVLEAHDSTQTRVDTDSTVFSSGAATSWTHLAFVANITGTGTDKTTLLIYVNKVLVAQTYVVQDLTAANHLQFSSDINFILGALNNNGDTNSNSFDGKIADFAIWNVALDADAVTAIYNSGRPTNLTLPLPNYDNQDVGALQGYWRMGNGLFDDKANGVVHDQFGNTGGDLVNGGDMSNTSNWSKGTGWDVNDTTSNKAVHANHSDDGGSTFDNLTQDIGAVPGKTYKVVFTVSGYGGSGFIRANVGGYNNGPNVTANGTYTHIIKNNHVQSNSTLYFSIEDSADATLDDVSVFEVAPGFGIEMVTNGHFDTNNAGWTQHLDNESSITQGTYGGRSGVARVVISTTGSTDRFRQDITWEKDCLYYFSVDVYLLSGKFRIDGVDADIIGVGPGSDANVLGTITYDAAVDDRWRTLTGYAQGQRTGGTDQIWIRSSGIAAEFYVDNLSVKKLNGFPALTSNVDVPTAFSSDAP